MHLIRFYYYCWNATVSRDTKISLVCVLLFTLLPLDDSPHIYSFSGWLIIMSVVSWWEQINVTLKRRKLILYWKNCQHSLIDWFIRVSEVQSHSILIKEKYSAYPWFFFIITAEHSNRIGLAICMLMKNYSNCV